MDAYEQYFNSLKKGEEAMTEGEFNAALAPAPASVNSYNVLKGEQLQDWLTIVIKRDSRGSANVEFHSRFHTRKVTYLRNSFGPEYSDAEILNDDIVLKHVYQCYGRDVFTSINTREFK